MMRILVVAFSLLFINQAVAQDVPSDWKTADSKYISIAHPANYKVTQYGEMKIVMNGVEPLESETDKFKENFGVIIKDLRSSNLSLEDFAKETRKELESAKNNTPTIVKFEEIQTPAGPAYQIEYRMELNGYQFYHYLRVFVKNLKGYSILYTAENQRRTYHQDLVDTMFNSVVLKD
jgi:hypothetical protein